MDRHHRFQALVTIGVVLTALCQYFWPSAAEHALAGTIITNVLWIWGE